MVVIWGLDLKELQWYKFGSKYMFGNKDYHLRRTKFIVYQLAMIFCVVSESLGTAVLSDFVDSQDYLRKHSGGRAVEHNNDYIGMASYNVFAGVYVAFIFGSAFFFDLFWPERREDRGIKIAWKGCSMMACVFMLASVILEIIIVAKRAAYVTGVPPEEAEALLKGYGGYPLKYNHNSRAIASVVFAWLGFPFVIYSTVIMWMSINYIDLYGPFSLSARAAKMPAKSPTSNESEPEIGRDGKETELNDMEQGRAGGAMQSPNGRVSKEGQYAGT